MSETEVRNEPARKKKQASIRMPAGYDRWIHLCMLFLMLFGLIMIASATMGQSVGNSNKLLITVVKQAVFCIFGYVVMMFLARWFKLDALRSAAFPNLAILMIFLLGATMFSAGSGGSQAWISIPFPGVEITIQPSEFAKILSVLIVAAYCGDVHRQFASGWQLVRRPVIFIGIYLLIILVLQSDLGSAAVLFVMVYVCFLIPCNPQLKKMQRGMTILFFIAVAGAVFLLSPMGESTIRMLPLKEYQINRILSAINPFSDQYDTGYQLINGLISFASGGWFGVGFGNSVRKYTSFPAASTDFILAIIVEELGFVGFLAVLIPYMIIIVRLFRYAGRIKSEKARIILVGTAMYFVVHFVFNVGGVTGLIPLTGVPLLMISAGGSSTLAAMSAIGIAQAVISAYKKGLIE